MCVTDKPREKWGQIDSQVQKVDWKIWNFAAKERICNAVIRFTTKFTSNYNSHQQTQTTWARIWSNQKAYQRTLEV